METTDREAGRAIAAARRTEVAIVADVHVVRAAAARRCRPILAEADIVETATAVAASTRSRIPDGECGTEIAGEVHAFVGAVVGE